MPTLALHSSDHSQSASLATKLRHLILEGRFPAQEPLPSHRDLASQYGVGVQVVRSALALLEEEGLVYKRERRGVFVRLQQSALPASTSPAAPWGKKQQAPAIRCINFLERTTGTVPGFVRTGYLHGFSEALDHLDIKMRFLSIPAEPESWESMFSPHFTFQQQGCILINILSEPLMNWLAGRQIPFVVQNNKAYPWSDYPPHHAVYINKVRGGFEAARHLVELGHQRIGFIGDVPADKQWTNDVYSGCLAGISYGGHHLNPDNVLHLIGSEPAGVHQPIRQYLSRPNRPTAIVTQNDMLALQVMRIARELGLRVPQDLSVVGYDNVPEAESADPPLTSFISPRVMLGRTAVQTLLALAADPSLQPQARMMEGHLMVRQSTAPPARR